MHRTGPVVMESSVNQSASSRFLHFGVQSGASCSSSSGYCSGSKSEERYLFEKRHSSKKPEREMKSLYTLDDGSTLGELSPVLTCIRSIQGSEALWEGGKLNLFKSLSFKELKSERNIKNEDLFCFAVSLQDGSTLYVSSSITTHLGYPKDMLVGQCIMNFLYQKDHITFANHLTQGLNACFTQGNKDDSHLVPNTFFCRLRVYHGLKFGYGISEKKTLYKPFKVTLHINDLIFDDVCVEKSASTLCVKATATPLSSAYQVPEEIPAMTSFSTRHTASCHFSHVDASAIPYLGYLPQDMIGYSIFDFYHIDDMPHLRDIYELVVKEQGSSFRSKPYHFKVFNGSYITLETEWSCFINPWSRKLEFVVGQHRVLKGPKDIAIFNPCTKEESIISDEIMKESTSIQNEIKNMLAQPIKNYGMNKTKRFTNKRKRDLVSLVYKFVDEDEEKTETHGNGDCSFSDADSVVMGDISPHRGSPETQPTCQELRYQENIERFFASQPKTFSGGSEDWESDEKLFNSDEYQVNSSKQVEEFQSSSISGPVYQNKQQESNSTSSKCNMSSFTTGDSGYGKSIDIDKYFSVNTTHASYNQIGDKAGSFLDTAKIPVCQALTEESLSQHNRLNHKYLKHQKCKVNGCHTSTTRKEYNWPKINEAGLSNNQLSSHKPKKCARIHSNMGASANPVQSEDAKVTFAHQPFLNLNSPFSVHNIGVTENSPATSVSHAIPSSSGFPSFGMLPYPYMSANYTPATSPAPFFMPVMYVGTVPSYPPMTNMMSPGAAVPLWPCTSVNPYASCHTAPASFPGHVHNVSPVGPQLSFAPTTKVAPSTNLGSSFRVQSSGTTATPSVLTTTTTVAAGVLPHFQSLYSSNDATPLFSKAHGNPFMPTFERNKYDSKKNVDCAMQVEDTRSFEFGPSTSHSKLTFDKIEDMDFEMKSGENCTRPARQDPPRLESVSLTADVVYRYQINVPNMDEVLKKDIEALKSMQQPELVNKQLQILQKELEEEGKTTSTSNDHQIQESIMLGLATEKEANEYFSMHNLQVQEDCHFSIVDDDV